MTGFYRDGSCTSGPEDMGSHTICAVVTAEFLAHQKRIGNDLSTPMPQYRFPGLVPGDRWCVTAANWLRAFNDGAAAPVVLASTHERALDIVPLEALRQHSVDVPADLSALEELGDTVDPMAIETRVLGRTGAEVTVLGYGAMELRGAPRGPEVTDEHAGRLLNAVLDGGITLIDTSPDYGRSEELIGEYVGHRREEFFLASKCGCPMDLPAAAPPPYSHDYSPANIRANVERSLTRLRTDRLDVLQVHMSPSVATMAENDVLETLQELQDEGKTRFIGMSGTIPELAGHIDLDVFDVFQIPYSAVQREHEDLIAAAGATGAGILIRGGAARGAPAADKGWRAGPLGVPAGEGQRRWETAGLDDLLHDSGLSPIEFTLRFTLSNPSLSSTIVGTSSPEHLAS
ncbi:MAG: aldo/keto reductase, partial [Actinomycetia bacterium]|nr:aldo/keto reductase [Actinomycetes bacterium]